MTRAQHGPLWLRGMWLVGRQPIPAGGGLRRVMVAMVAMSMAAAATAVAFDGGVGGGDGAGDGGDGCGAVAAWVTGGGIDGGGGETLAACAAAACRSGGPRLVASILCEPERMRSGRCQHVCMRCVRVRAVARTLRRKSPDANSSRPDDAVRAPGRRQGLQLWKKRHVA